MPDHNVNSDLPVYQTRLNRDRTVHIYHDDLKIMDQLVTLFRLEGFQTAIYFDAANFEQSLPGFSEKDVILLASEVDDVSTVDILKNCRLRQPGVPAFYLLLHSNIHVAVQAMKLGASDVFTVPIDAEYLMRNVTSVLRRGVEVVTDVSGATRIVIRGFSELTKREKEVLQLVTSGSSNKAAAKVLGISDRTVEFHRAKCMEKLGARNATELTKIVLTR